MTAIPISTVAAATTAPTTPATAAHAAPEVRHDITRERPSLHALLALVRESTLPPCDALVYQVCQSDALAATKAWAAATLAAGRALEALMAAVAGETAEAPAEPPIDPTGATWKNSRRRLFDAGVIDMHDSELLAWVMRFAFLREQSRSTVDASWAIMIRRSVFAAADLLIRRRAAWRKKVAA